MITPKEIEEKVFKTAKIGGFDKEDVNVFLDEIIIDMDKLIKENEALRVELTKAKVEIEKNSNTEASLYDTLETAKSLMNDIAASAERRAEVLLKNAELDCEVIKREAKDDVKRYISEALRLKTKVESYRSRYIELLQNELKRAEDMSQEFLAEFEGDFLPKDDSSEEDLEKTIVVEKIKD